ncbi:MAG: hypothetical protein ACO1N9_12700 [Flavobacterium sp.]
MKTFYILLLLFANLCFAQQKAFTPKSGEIVFVKQESAEEKERYKEFGRLLKEQIVDESRNTDTTAINQTLKEISKTVNAAVSDIEKRHHEFSGDKIVSYHTTNGIRGDYYGIIDTKTGLRAMVTKRDSVTIKLSEQPYYTPYKKGTTMKIEEYLKDIKKIQGFDCFKISVIVKTHIDEDDLSSLEMTTKYEMWVTDRIRCLYHPIVWFKEVLEKYYPLEIIETSDMLVGSTIYSLASFSLK